MGQRTWTVRELAAETEVFARISQIGTRLRSEIRPLDVRNQWLLPSPFTGHEKDIASK
jgi:hypothetical protein